MTEEELQLLARFRSDYKREFNEVIDLPKLVHEAPYASEIFKTAQKSEDEEFLFLTLKLMYVVAELRIQTHGAVNDGHYLNQGVRYAAS